MNVLIAADMEGIAGIEDYGECLPSHPGAYARGCRLMTDEVLVAIEAVRRAGGDGRISVGDWHMVGTNIERDRMPDGVEVSPIAELALAETDPTLTKAHGGPLDAVVFLGHHAATPTPRAFCSHTFVWDMEVLLDGESLSEVQVYGQALAAEGIPVLAAAGDRWMLEQLGEGELGSARLVATKEGETRARAHAFEVGATRGELADAIEGALSAPLRPPPARSYPAELRVLVEGAELASRTLSGAAELLPAVAEAFRTGAVSREYRQLAGLLPAAADARIRRRLGGLLATPVMLLKERRWLASSP